MDKSKSVERKRKAILIRFFDLHGKLIIKDGLYDSRDIGYNAEKDQFIFDEWSPRENVSYQKTVLETNKAWDWVVEEEPDKLKAIADRMETKTGTVQIFDSYANSYQEKYMDVSFYKETFDWFCDFLPRQDGELLDIACGPGNVTRYLLDRCPDLKVLGIDLAPRMLDLAKQNNPEAEFRLMDGRKIRQLDRVFDGIMCGFCLPYLSREEAIALFADAVEMLHPEGVMYISTMEGDEDRSGWQGPSSGGNEKLYMHYHRSDYLKEGLLEVGFSQVDVYRLNYSAGGGPDTIDLILIARK